MSKNIKKKTMKTKFFIYPQLNSLFYRTAIEAEILFAVRLNKKQALTGGKGLACYLFISYLYLFNYLCNNK